MKTTATASLEFAPFLVTVCPYEAMGYTENNDDLVVESVPMSPEVMAWVQEFVAAHHVDEPSSSARTSAIRTATTAADWRAKRRFMSEGSRLSRWSQRKLAATESTAARCRSRTTGHREIRARDEDNQPMPSGATGAQGQSLKADVPARAGTSRRQC